MYHPGKSQPNGTLASMQRTFEPRYVSYYGDGSGRDQQITLNNGGLTGVEKTGMGHTGKQFSKYNSNVTQRKSPSPHKDAPTFYYMSDGSGRDTYVLQNNGGLRPDYDRLNKSPGKIFTDSLRNGPKSPLKYFKDGMKDRADITTYLNWQTQKAKIANQKHYQLQTNLVNRLTSSPHQSRRGSVEGSPYSRTKIVKNIIQKQRYNKNLPSISGENVIETYSNSISPIRQMREMNNQSRSPPPKIKNVVQQYNGLHGQNENLDHLNLSIDSADEPRYLNTQPSALDIHDGVNQKSLNKPGFHTQNTSLQQLENFGQNMINDQKLQVKPVFTVHAKKRNKLNNYLGQHQLDRRTKRYQAAGVNQLNMIITENKSLEKENTQRQKISIKQFLNIRRDHQNSQPALPKQLSSSQPRYRPQTYGANVPPNEVRMKIRDISNQRARKNTLIQSSYQDQREKNMSGLKNQTGNVRKIPTNDFNKTGTPLQLLTLGSTDMTAVSSQKMSARQFLGNTQRLDTTTSMPRIANLNDSIEANRQDLVNKIKSKKLEQQRGNKYNV